MTVSAIDAVLDVARAIRQHPSPVIDADTHITDIARAPDEIRARYSRGPGYFHGRPNSAEDLIEEMDLSGVDMALCWQDPASTAYEGDKDRNAEALLAANRYVFESARRHRGRIIPAGWTDPHACGLSNALRIVEICVQEFGFFIVKMNPAQNGYFIHSPDVTAVVDRIIELGAAPAFHFGADSPYTPASGLERLLLRHPDQAFLGVHMGGGGCSYEGGEELAAEARRLGLQYPQLRYILSAKRDTHMETDLLLYQQAGPPFSGNLFCASDAPYGRVSWNFGGFRQMLRTLEIRHPEVFSADSSANFLGRNFARFALQGVERLLRVQGETARAWQ